MESTNPQFALTLISNIGPKDDLMPPLVKKSSAETHVSSAFITERLIGCDKIFEDQERGVTVLFSSVYHVPYLYGFFFPFSASVQC